jgi:hypothetical protein
LCVHTGQDKSPFGRTSLAVSSGPGGSSVTALKGCQRREPSARDVCRQASPSEGHAAAGVGCQRALRATRTERGECGRGAAPHAARTPGGRRRLWAAGVWS